MRPVQDERSEAARAELPCVWVSAGVLSYRLCDRQFDCERCPLHQALKGGAEFEAPAGEGAGAPLPAALDDPVTRFLGQTFAGCILHLGRAYSAEGLWLDVEASGMVRVGMDDVTLRLLQPLDDIVLPKPGVWLRHGAPCAWVHRGRMQLAVRSPVSGEVVEVHSCPMLALPAAESNGERWWFLVKPHESVAMAAGLYRGEALLAWSLARARAVHEQLAAAMAPARTAGGVGGPALADGGMPITDLAMVLGRERFESLIGTLFPQ